MNLDKSSTGLVGFFQAMGVAIYCFLIASFFNYMERFSGMPDPPHALGALIMLLLLVVSATICGVLVFGYPVYLILRQNTKRAIKIIAYTITYSIAIFFITLAIIIYSY